MRALSRMWATCKPCQRRGPSASFVKDVGPVQALSRTWALCKPAAMARMGMPLWHARLRVEVVASLCTRRGQVRAAACIALCKTSVLFF